MITFGLSALPAFAQSEVSGTVTDAEGGTPLPGVNVVVEGTQVGTITGPDGQYSLQVPAEGEALLFSFVGYQVQRVPIQGRSTVDVALEATISELDEVVVTALGIERQEKSLSYSTAQVDAAELVKVNTPDVATALYGKLPGVSIKQNASGGGINLTIRGARSLTGNSRPLLVVDGIPIRDEDSGYSTVGWVYDRDTGSGLNDLNPEDVQSISVLKGAAAAALYGSEAANGVVLVTTKNGRGLSQEGLGVEFTSAMDFTSVAQTLNFQNEFGAGAGRYQMSDNNDGTFNLTEDGVPMVTTSSYSWGPRMEGQEVMWWDGVMRPYSPQPDNYYDLFDMGVNSTQTIALADATESLRYRLSYTRGDLTRVVPGAEQTENNFSLAADLDLAPQLSTQVKVNYYKKEQYNPPPKLYVAYNFPRSLKTPLLKEYFRTPDGYHIGYARSQGEFSNLAGSTQQIMDQLYWRQLADVYDYDTDHLISSITVQYNPVEWINLRVRAGSDLTINNLEEKNSSTQPSEVGPTGGYARTKSQSRIVYTEGIATFTQQVTEDLGVEVLAGAAFKRFYLDHAFVGTNGGLVKENWFSQNNSRQNLNESAWRASEGTDGLFGNIRFSYRDYLFLDATGRNDWTSTLPPGNNSYFYPSLGLSFVFSEAFDLPSYMSYGKVRASYGEVGRGANRYQANKAYSYGQWEGVTTNSFSSTVPPTNLRPERQKSVELGLNLAFFSNRAAFDLSYYNQRNIDLITNLQVAQSSGANAITVNNGLMVNSGIEAQVSLTPVLTDDFSWDATVNFAKNWNRIEELAAGLERLVHTGIDDQIFIESRPGQEFGAIYGYDYRLSPEGERIVDESGIYAKSSELTHQGNILPDWTGGLLNTFRYKNFSLGTTIDLSVGGDIISMTNYWGYSTGKWEETLDGRDESLGGLPYYFDDDGEVIPLSSHDATTPDGQTVYHDGIVLDGVVEVFDEAGEVVGYEQNDQVVPVYDYYLLNYNWRGQGIYPEAVYDNSYVKLRELTLGYTLPESWTARTPLRRMSLSLLGRNLGYLFKNVPNIDPESAISSDPRLQGYEYMTWPVTRSFGFRVNATF